MRARLPYLPAAVVLCLTGACATSKELARAEEAGTRPTGREEHFLDWTRLRFAPEVYAARRGAMMEELAIRGGGAFLAPSRESRSGGGTFRQEDDFLYFTGLELPNSVLVIDADEKRATIFAPERDPRFESASRPNDFPGRLLADDAAIQHAAGIEIWPVDRLEERVTSLVRKKRPLWVDLGRTESSSLPETDFVFAWSAGEALAFHAAHRWPKAKVENAFSVVAGLRMVKSPEEIEVLRRAAAITAEGIRFAAGHVRPGVTERDLEAELEASFKRAGAQRLAFDSIIKSGPNSLWPWRILAAHYDRRNRAMREGELVIFDVGCELDHYASDAGRTFPVSGSFTEDQKHLIEMTTAASDAVIAAIRPGVTFGDLRDVALARIPPEERPYMQARLFFGHHLGLDVGDPSLENAPLAPGMLFTVEPWYYNHDRGVAVFLEDEILVTESGAENLTATLPRTPAELEAWVGAR